MTFYHTSTKKDLKIITPKGNFEREGLHGAMVFLSIKPKPHYTLRSYPNIPAQAKLYVYEVEPIGKVKYSTHWGEYFTLQQCYVRRLVRTVPFTGWRSVKGEDASFKRDKRHFGNRRLYIGNQVD